MQSPEVVAAVQEIISKRLPRGWKTTPYILGNEISERIASYGLTWSMVLYLVQVYNLKRESAAYLLSIVAGISGLCPLLGGILADSYLGRYRTILIGSVFNLLGMICLLLTSTTSRLTPCGSHHNVEKKQCHASASNEELSFLYLAFVFLAVGGGGVRSSSYAFGADQFSKDTIEERKNLQSFFNWYFVGLNLALLIASSLIAYIQLEVSWTWGFGIPTALMAISIIILLVGSSLYYHVIPSGSPFVSLAHVVVAAFHKRKLFLPPDATNKLHHDTTEIDMNKHQNVALTHTNQFRFLDKATLRTEEEQMKLIAANAIGASPSISKWRLCNVEEVESLKCIMRLIPVWVSSIIPSMYLTQVHIWVPLQATSMNRQIGHSGFEIPESSMSIFSVMTVVLFLPFYDKVFVPMWRSQHLVASDPIRGITLLQRIGIGHVLVTLSPIIAAFIEKERRKGTMHVIWLAPQLVALGIADAFNIVGQIEFLYDQAPPQMKSMSTSMFVCTVAIGGFLGSIFMAIIQKISHGTWIKEQLSKGHLDYYYFFLAGLLALNCMYYFSIISFRIYDNPSRSLLMVEGKYDVENKGHNSASEGLST